MAVQADAVQSTSFIVTPSELVSNKTSTDTSPQNPNDSNQLSSESRDIFIAKSMAHLFFDPSNFALSANDVVAMSPLARDQSDEEKVVTGASSLPELKIAELLWRVSFYELPPLQTLSSWSTIPLCYFHDFLKAVMSKKVLRLIFHSITKLLLQEVKPVLGSLPIQLNTTKFPPIHGNIEKAVRGIPNYGQTCFLNSVLQALASLEPFLSYLDGIVHLQEQNLPKKLPACFSHHLLQMLKCVNGGIQWNDVAVGPRDLLGYIAEKNSQFSGRHLQQQDAQELMEALINIVLNDARSVSDVLRPIFLSLENMSANSPNEVLTAGIVGDGDRTTKEHDLNDRTQLEESCYIGFSDALHRLELEETQRSSSHKPHAVQRKGPENYDYEGEFQESKVDTRASALCLSIKPESLTATAPFNGWCGSVLRCSKCKYIRPIRNAPFLSTPLVPTAVLHYSTNIQRQQSSTGTPIQSHLPACSLEQCLSAFTDLERVSGVECPQCTMQEETNELRHEQSLLCDAIDSIEKKRRRTENPISHHALRSDLSRVQHRLSFLGTTDPDDVYTTSSQSDDDMMCLPASQQMPLLRSDALKCLTLTRYPKVLCCHIQRLFVNMTTGKTEKCPQHVQFPQLLDLSRFCAYSQKADTSWAAGSLRDAGFPQTGDENPPIYRLKAAIEHIGTADFGHYVTFREDSRGGWCRISDNIVTPVPFAEVRNCQAYMLFYELTIINAS